MRCDSYVFLVYLGKNGVFDEATMNGTNATGEEVLHLYVYIHPAPSIPPILSFRTLVQVIGFVRIESLDDGCGVGK